MTFLFLSNGAGTMPFGHLAIWLGIGATFPIDISLTLGLF
jgi:hypothetical protein